MNDRRRFFTAEAVGTFLLVFFGCGSVHAAVLFGAQVGLWQVAIVWGIAIALAIYVTGAVSGAHLNPAVTIACFAFRSLPSKLVPVYVSGQLIGAFLAAVVLYVCFASSLKSHEAKMSIERGRPGSEITAGCYGEFYPNPGRLDLSILESSDDSSQLSQLETSMPKASTAEFRSRYQEWQASVSHNTAFFAEFIGTCFLVFAIFALTDSKNDSRPSEALTPILIGLTVSILISLFAPLTQAGFNPARDFGPRLFAAMAGWGKISLPLGTDWGWLTVYIVAPITGGLAGGSLYQKIMRPCFVDRNSD